MCRTPSKQIFLSRRDALTFTKRSKGPKLRPYQCDCGFWHLTSMRPDERRALRKRQRVA